jgi:hypothetical protein
MFVEVITAGEIETGKRRRHMKRDKLPKGDDEDEPHQLQLKPVPGKGAV